MQARCAFVPPAPPGLCCISLCRCTAQPRTTGPANVTKCQAEGYERPLAPADMARLSVGAYTAERALALLRSAAPEFMRRVDELYSFGLAQDPRQERYQSTRSCEWLCAWVCVAGHACTHARMLARS